MSSANNEKAGLTAIEENKENGLGSSLVLKSSWT